MMDLTPDIKRIKDTAREINSLASRIDNCQKILKAMQKSEEKGLQLITELNISGFGVLDVSDDDMKPVLMQVADQYAAIPKIRELQEAAAKLIKEYDEMHKTAMLRAEMHAKIMGLINSPELLSFLKIEFIHREAGNNFSFTLGKGSGLDSIMAICAQVYQDRTVESIEALREVRDEHDEMVNHTLEDFLNTNSKE